MGETYTIKPLEWESNFEETNHFAPTLNGGYRVFKSRAEPWVWVCLNRDDMKIRNCESVEAGKAAAEQHYLERLKTALEPCQPAEAEIKDMR